MDYFDKIYQLHHLFTSNRYAIPRKKIEKELECSPATAKRIIARMRDYLGAPIVYNHEAQGYAYDHEENPQFELPGLWFNAAELHALLSLQHLIAGLKPGLLDDLLLPVKKRIESILTSKYLNHAEVAGRVKILGMAVRQGENDFFKSIATAVLHRQRMTIAYHSRSTDQLTTRDISPQRLCHYRDNWYFDAWDHGKQALRSFAVERVKSVTIGKQKAKEIKDEKLDDYFCAAYGIFSGKAGHKAVLRFNATRARWVAEENWHPGQKGYFVEGDYVLEVPYADPRELVMDILKYGPDVEVLGPAGLRRAVKERMEQALEKYGVKKNKRKKKTAIMI